MTYIKTKIAELPRISDRVTYIYIEHAKINRVDGAVMVTESRGIVKIPVAMIGVIFIGPGTDISHRAMELLGEAGVSIIWVGEQGIRYYAHGRSLSNSSKLLETQAKLVSNTHSRLLVSKKMYNMRFPEDDISNFTMRQLRAKEGARVKKVYRNMALEYGVNWKGRIYDPNNFEGGDPINQALSVANVALYGVVHSVIVAMGMSTGLGFIHTGHELSFVYDIADLYKVDITFPIAFQVASEYEKGQDISKITRYKVRDIFVNKKIFMRIVKDLQFLMGIDEKQQIKIEYLSLWDDKEESLKYGINYSEGEDY